MHICLVPSNQLFFLFLVLKSLIVRLEAESRENQRSIVEKDQQLRDHSQSLLLKTELLNKAAASQRMLEERNKNNTAYIASLTRTLDESVEAAKAHQLERTSLKNSIEEARREVIALKLLVEKQKNEIAMLGGELAQDVSHESSTSSAGGSLLLNTNWGSKEQVLRDVAWGATVNVHVPKTRSRYIQAHQGSASCARYMIGGKFIATGGADGKVCLWSAQNGGRINSLTGPTQAITSVSVSPNASSFVATSVDKKAYVWGTHARPISVLVGHSYVLHQPCECSVLLSRAVC